MEILNLFTKSELEKFREKRDGNFAGDCICCGYNCIINVEQDSYWCFRSKRRLNLLEATALKLNAITCSDNITDEETKEEIIVTARNEFGENFAANLTKFLNGVQNG